MSVDRKHDARSVLKGLPPDRQAVIAEYSVKHSLTEIKEWLAADGVKTSETAISNWLADYRLEQRLRVRENVVAAIIEEMKKDLPSMLPEDHFKVGQFLFSGLAIADKDTDAWVQTQRLQLLAEKNKLLQESVELDREKFQFKAAEAVLKVLPTVREIAANDALDQTEKVNAVRMALFGVVAE